MVLGGVGLIVVVFFFFYVMIYGVNFSFFMFCKKIKKLGNEIMVLYF